MSAMIKIECLAEPELLFGSGQTGVEPRRVMAKSGAADAASARQKARAEYGYAKRKDTRGLRACSSILGMHAVPCGLEPMVPLVARNES